MAAFRQKRCVVTSSSEEDVNASLGPVEDEVNTPVRKRLRRNDTESTPVFQTKQSQDTNRPRELRKPKEHLKNMSPEARRAKQRAVISGDEAVIQVSDMSDDPHHTEHADEHALEDSSEEEADADEEDDRDVRGSRSQDPDADQDLDPGTDQDPEGEESEGDLEGFVVSDDEEDLGELQAMKDEYLKLSHWESFRKVLRNELRLVTFPGDPPEPGLLLAEDAIFGELDQLRFELLSFSWVTAFHTHLKKDLEQLPGLVVASWVESDRARPETDSDDDSSSSGDVNSNSDGSGIGDGDDDEDVRGCKHQESKRSEDDDEDDESYLYEAHMHEKRPCSLCSRKSRRLRMVTLCGTRKKGSGEYEERTLWVGVSCVNRVRLWHALKHLRSRLQASLKRKVKLRCQTQNITLEKAVAGLNGCESYQKWLFKLFNDLVECARRLNRSQKPVPNNARFGPPDAKKVTCALRDLHPLPAAEESDVEENDTAPAEHIRHQHDQCFYCKQIGHWAMDCPNKPQNLPCHFCDQIGHEVLNCHSRVHT